MRMNVRCVVAVLLVAVAPFLHAADPAELAGRWIGSIGTPRGQMEIALNLMLDEGQLTGVLETAHGEWKVTRVTEKEGVWTVSFEGPDGSGSLTGRVKAAQFTGAWVSPMAKGTFELRRAKRRS